jgi:Predicted eukaryotic-type DNA primase
VMGVSISHPDKPLWPDEKPPITKLELAQYYEEVGDWMIGHIKGRPCSIVRTPDGIRPEVLPAPRHAGRLGAAQRGQGERRQEALSADRSRRSAGGGGADRRHRTASPGTINPDQPTLPGRLVFDLDPAPNVKFDEVIEGALELRKRLEKLGLVTFCKTTGGKGLHVVTPSRRTGRAPTGRPPRPSPGKFVGGWAKQPERYLLNMAKKERGGRIFLDYLRNDRTSTAVAPLSPRARGAPRCRCRWNGAR